MSDLPSIDQTETESVESDTNSIKSTASAILKPTGIKQPTVTTRIGRPCCAGHLPKPGLPPPPEPKNNMRRQSDDFSRSHLSDVFEESEADLMSERLPRSIKSKSPDSFSSKTSKSDRKISNGSTNSDLYMEATGRRHSSDQGTILTSDTDSFIIGQRIWVGGIRPGLIAYIGETHFAPGEWAGVVLDDPNGKNDGCVAGKRYFQCESKRGIFSRLTRLTRAPLPGGAMSTSDLSMNVSSRSITSPSRSGTVSPTQSMKSFSGKTPTKSNLTVGDRVIVSSGMGSRVGVLQYIGETKFAPGNWCGVQLDDASGKNDGSVDGVKYFDCPAQYGIFVPLAKVSLSPSARKPRLSRSGSKESLTSVGTLGSITSTATSRLRMSAQRLSSTAKPITAPKNTFSLQEVLREKQNHIEHLLIERDLDRQDSENNAMMYQKTINQLKENIASLEKQLNSEKQKSEDLQTSVDEATFCTDELNVLTQEYKDRVAVLEAQVGGKEPPDGKASFEGNKQTEEISRLQKQIERLTTSSVEKQSELQVLERTNRTLTSEMASNIDVQKASIEELTGKIAALESSNKYLEEQLQNMTQQNDEMQSELRLEVETKKQECLHLKLTENVLREEVDVLKNEIKLRESAMAGCDSEIQNLIEAKDTIIAEHNEAAVGSEHLHIMIVKQKDEEIAQFMTLTQELRTLNESLSNDKSNLLQEIEKNASLIDSLQKKVDESSKSIAQFENDSAISLKLIENNKQQHEDVIKTFESINNELEEKVTQLLAINANMSAVLEKDKTLESELRQQIQISIENLAQSEKVKLEQQEVLVNRDKFIENQQKVISDLQNKFGEITAKNEALQKELSDFRLNAESADGAFAKLSAELKNSTNELNEKRSQLEASQSSLSLTLEKLKVLSEQISVFNNEIEHLKASLDASLSSVAELSAKVVSLEDVHRSDMQTADTLTKEMQALNSQIDVLTKNNLTLSEDLKNTLCALESKKLENDSNLNKTKELRQQLDSLHIIVATKNEEVCNIQRANNDLQAKLEASVQSVNDVQEKLFKLEVEYGDVNRKRALLDEKCEQLFLEKTSLQQNVDALQNSSSDTNSEVHRLSAELQQKQKSYEELTDKTNSIQLSLEKKLHETTQNLAARTTQWEGVKNEIENLTMQKMYRENELNLELSKMKEAVNEEKCSLVQQIDELKIFHQKEKERLLKEIDEKLKESDTSRSELNLSIENLEKTVDELQKMVEKSKNDILEKEEQFESKIKVMRSIEEDLRKQLDESNRKELELKNSVNDVMKSGVESIEQLTKELDEEKSYSKNLKDHIVELQLTHEKATVEHNELKAKLLAEEKSNEELAKASAQEKETFIEIKSILEQELVQAMSKFKSTEDEQVDLVNRNVELVQQVEQLTNEISKSNNRNNETNDQLAKVLSEFEAFKLSEDQMKKDIDSKIADSFKRETENIKMLESQNVQLMLAIKDKEKEIEIISSSLREAKHETETQKAVAATMKESKQAQINSQHHVATEHLNTIRHLEDKIVQLTSSVNMSDDLKNELNHKSEEIKSKEINIRELSDTVDALKEQISAKEMDLKRLLNEQEKDGKRSMDVIDRKDVEIKSMDLELMMAKKTLEDKIAEVAQISDERASLLLAKSSLVEEISRLNDQIKDYNENFVDRTELNNLKEEFSMYEEIKGKEIADLSKKLLEIEEQMKNQRAGVDKLEILERQKKEISYEKTALERREAQLVLENKQLADKLLQMKANNTAATAMASDNETGAQISFLNSIIADMQRKNETLTYRIQALESAPSDFVNNGLFDLPVKRQPAPRLFCDICDEFDAHETEDCPLQSSDSPPPPINVPEMTSTVKAKDSAKERKLPPPRKYCESCEAFGHDSSECDNEEIF